MAVYCTTPATLRLENLDGSGNITQTLDLMDQANGYRVDSLELAWPAVREVVAALPTRDGQFDTTRLFGPRTVTVTGSVLPTPTARQANLDALAWWCQPALRPRLVYQVDAAVTARTIGLRGAALGAPYTNPFISAFSVSWVADDPAAYAYNPQQLTIGPAQIAAGRRYPLTFNRLYVPSAPGGYGTVTNNGSYQTWPRFKIFGPCTNPAIYYQTPAVGQVVTAGMTVLAGDYVAVDTRAATVLYNGQAGASRYSQVDVTQTTWAPFQPGPTGIRFVTATSSAPCALEVDWSDAFLA
jgi:hypothetical protein